MHCEITGVYDIDGIRGIRSQAENYSAKKV